MWAVEHRRVIRWLSRWPADFLKDVVKDFLKDVLKRLARSRSPHQVASVSIVKSRSHSRHLGEAPQRARIRLFLELCSSCV